MHDEYWMYQELGRVVSRKQIERELRGSWWQRRVVEPYERVQFFFSQRWWGRVCLWTVRNVVRVIAALLWLALIGASAFAVLVVSGLTP